MHNTRGRQRYAARQVEYRHSSSRGLIEVTADVLEMFVYDILLCEVPTTAFVPFVAAARDRFYKQPGHPQHKLSKAGGRFSKQKSMETWDPSDPKGLNTKQPIRDLKEV